MREIIISESNTKNKAVHYAQEDPNSKIVLIIYPQHPQIGEMHERVGQTIFNAFIEKGFSAMKIGLDISENTPSKHSDAKNDLTMAATALDWLHTMHPNASSIWVAGFSSGSWIVSQLIMRRPEINRFIALSLPVNKYDLSFLHPCPVSGLIIQGEKDSVVLPSKVLEFVNTIHKQKGIEIDYELVDKADHFYRDKGEELKETILRYLEETMNKLRPQKIKIDRRKCTSRSLVEELTSELV